MGIMNKIKGIFMEEVIVEEDEDDDDKNEKIKAKDKVQVAKKIETPAPVEEKKEEIKKEDIDEEIETLIDEERTKEFYRGDSAVTEPVIEHRFPNFDDKDFEMDERKEEPVKFEETKVETPPVQEPNLYHEKRVDRESIYDYSVAEVKKEPHKEPYEGNQEKKKGFQRSPIISPVYGILDKNYKKEEIVSKREIRLTTNNQKADLDLVREKAYGDLANDISESIHEEIEHNDSKEDDSNESTNLLYDLSDDKSPSVKDVTMGDAEEYFNDLGLEYNVDYKVEKEEPSIKNEYIDNDKKNDNEVSTNEDEDDTELFNLIDEMYNNK